MKVSTQLFNKQQVERFGKLNEISEVVCFLASDGAAYITGQNMRVDGGLTKSI